MAILLFACGVALVAAILVGLTSLISVSTEVEATHGVSNAEVIDFLGDAERAWASDRPARTSEEKSPAMNPAVGLAA